MDLCCLLPACLGTLVLPRPVGAPGSWHLSLILGPALLKPLSTESSEEPETHILGSEDSDKAAVLQKGANPGVASGKSELLWAPPRSMGYTGQGSLPCGKRKS